MKSELKKIQKSLETNDPNDLDAQSEEEQVGNGNDAEQMRSSRAAFLEITQQFLRRMKLDNLADSLKDSKCKDLNNSKIHLITPSSDVAH